MFTRFVSNLTDFDFVKLVSHRLRSVILFIITDLQVTTFHALYIGSFMFTVHMFGPDRISDIANSSPRVATERIAECLGR
jgi:hypothetical protein